MKAKRLHPNINRRRQREEDPLPHELGTHLFAMIRRNLLARQQPPAPMATQMSFGFR
jgi:hypothetical protein